MVLDILKIAFRTFKYTFRNQSFHQKKKKNLKNFK